MSKFDSKTFNPNAFAQYVKAIPNLNQNALAKSRAIGTNEQARISLSSQTGSIYASVPYFGRISGKTSQNNDGATNIDTSNLSTYEQGFVVASRMDSWTEKSFSKNITAGVDFMSQVATQISDYKYEVKQEMLLQILKGIFGMSTTGTDAKAKAQKSFVEGNTNDISGATENVVNGVTLNKTIQKAGGDNKNTFKLAIMHSEVSTNLENLRVLEYLKYTDANGITQDLQIGTWNGKTVLIDDNMPMQSGYYAATADTEGALKVVATGAVAGQINLADVKKGEFFPSAVKADDYVVAGEKYTTYVLGEASIVLNEIGDSVPYEMSRDPKTNGGQDTLYVRDRYMIGADGLSFVKPNGVSVTNEQLATGTNWEIVNDGINYLPHKAIPIARIISRG